MAIEPSTPREPEDDDRRADLLPLVGDIRSSRPYLLAGSPLRAGVRRTLSIAALVCLDVAGLALGLYGALTLRELYRGHTQPLWGVLWEAEADWQGSTRLRLRTNRRPLHR